MYAVRYFGQHYWNKRRSNLNEEDALVSWQDALHNIIFLTNMLYISLSSSVLTLYACDKVEPGVYVMTSNNSVRCYEGDHAITLYLSIIPLLLYVIGWPLTIGGIFYAADARLKLNDPTYVRLYGFLYKRYEAQWYYWHIFIAFYKFEFVIIKAFFFLKFTQGPLVSDPLGVLQAMLAVFVFVLMQSWCAVGNARGVCLYYDAILRKRF